MAGTTEKMSDIDSEKEPQTGYRFIDLAVLAHFVSLVACPKCGHKLTLTETKKQSMSHSNQMLFVILFKGVNGNIPSGHLKKRNKCFDVNRRSFIRGMWD